MDLIILAVLLPLVIVPIVLLFGFAGCASFGEEVSPAPPPAPFNLQATAVGTDQIRLTWQHNSAGGVEFRVGRQRADGSWDDLHGTPTPATAMEFLDKLLDQGKTYNYRVRAITPGMSSTPSDPSNEKAATTWKWETAYLQPLTKPPALDGPTYSGDCLVQRIDKALLKFSGKRTRVTLRGATTLTILNAFVSRAIPGTGSSRWQPAADLTRLSGALIVAADTPQTLPDVDYALTNSEDLLIAFDIASGEGRRLNTGVGASVGFVKNGTPAVPAQEASLPTRTTTGWSTQNNTVSLVERIDVLIT
jgi:hypothetical protein